ncbi:hypothetical protein AB0J83_17040 [Actinoplanes sp. NPDC049596]|uniref:hypothetical protein n=1 Tax=unclassified Actinoplanes TaxID=2626549 RepID=UPI0034308134
MRSRLVVLGALPLLLLAACDDKPGEEPAAAAPPPVAEPVQLPASAAGGACALWDYGVIEENIGVQFTVAAADQVDATSTCVVQTVDAPYPDLTLSVVKSTAATADQFLDDLMPAKGIRLKGLGQAAYLLKAPAAGVHGPATEIGWLSKAKQLRTLRFTFPRNAESTAVTAMNKDLFTLAKAMDSTKP